MTLLTLSLLAGCAPSPSAEESQSGPLRRIVCTTGMVGDLVQAIAGDEVEVIVLMPAGVDPHLFTPAPQDVVQMARADAIVYSGLHLEAGLAGYLEKMSQQNHQVYALSEGIPSERLIAVSENLYDPHFWNDLELWQLASQAFAAKISRWNPAQAAQYEQRSAEYQQQVSEILQASRQQIEAIPPEHRVLITAHDAFHYLGRSLNLEVAAVQGISTNTETSVRKIEELVQRIVEQKIPAIFTESSVNDKAIRAILQGCQRQGYELQMGGILYSDALGPAGSQAETFLKMYEHNVNTIAKALQ